MFSSSMKDTNCTTIFIVNKKYSFYFSIKDINRINDNTSFDNMLKDLKSKLSFKNSLNEKNIF